jgi:hypothetical protein
LTAVQLAAEIRKKLSSYVVNPEVSVIVLQVNAPKYFMMGYITRPGTYPPWGRLGPAGPWRLRGVHAVRLPEEHQADPEREGTAGDPEDQLLQPS